MSGVHHGESIKMLLKALIALDKTMNSSVSTQEFVSSIKHFGGLAIKTKNTLLKSSHPQCGERLNAACIAVIKAGKQTKASPTNTSSIRSWNQCKTSLISTVKEIIATPITYKQTGDALSALESLSLMMPPSALPPPPGVPPPLPDVDDERSMDDIERKNERSTPEQMASLEERRRSARENQRRRREERRKREEEERKRNEEEQRNMELEDQKRRKQEAERKKAEAERRAKQLAKEEEEHRKRVKRERERAERLFDEALLPSPMSLPPPPSAPESHSVDDAERKQRETEASQVREMKKAAQIDADAFWEDHRSAKSGLVGISARLMALGPAKRTIQECRGQLRALAEIESTRSHHAEELPRLEDKAKHLGSHTFSGKYHSYKYERETEARNACAALRRTLATIDDEFEAKRILVASMLKRLRAEENKEQARIQQQQQREREERERREKDRRALEDRYARNAAEEERRTKALEKDRQRGEVLLATRERAEKERKDMERKEKERKEKERMDRERMDRERMDRERKEKERKEKERKEKERKEKERKEKERKEKERKEKERKEQEREAKEKDRKEKDRKEKERKEREAREKERKEREAREKEREEKERKEKERKEREAREKERKEKERKEREAREKERKEKERKEREAREKERKEREAREKERKAKERKERDAIDKEALGSSVTARTRSHTSSSPVINVSNASKDRSSTISAPTDTPMHSKSVPGGTRGIGSRWANLMANKEAEEEEKARQIMRDRREKGAKHVDEQLAKLIKEIQRVSSSHPCGGAAKGICAVKYGDLFSNTMGTMSELSATLNTAKKRKVVQYEGFMLRQGFDDDTVVVLLSETFEKTKVSHSRIVPRKSSAASAPSMGAPAKCFACGKTAYVTERLLVNGKTFHKACFKCSMCKRTLKLAEYSFVNDTYYCKPCFVRGHSSGEIKFTSGGK